MGEKLSKLNERQVKIWEYLVENKTVTAKECEKLIPQTPRITLNHDLKQMCQLGLMQQTGQSRNTFYQAVF